MPFEPVDPDDADQIAALVAIHDAARQVDDPDSYPLGAELMARWVRYGKELDPETWFLYRPMEDADPVGTIEIDLPKHDNLHLVWTGLTVHPEHRRRGHGSAMMREVLRQARDAGRTTVWVGLKQSNQYAKAFVEGFGFRYASLDARRRQRVTDLDWPTLDRLFASAAERAADYQIEEVVAPASDELLEQMVEVTAAINDAPMGELTFEDERIDVDRLRKIQQARLLRGDRGYQLAARHRSTGEIGGHTMICTNPLRPSIGIQWDTAVARQHRGHRLGLLLKLANLRRVLAAEPDLEVIETFNNTDNDFMINVNEAMGYRLSALFEMHELTLT